MFPRRHWPDEAIPWVQGVITDYNDQTGEHTIVYDINMGDKQSWECTIIENLRPQE